MSCEVKKVVGFKVNGGQKLYGGSIQAFSIGLGGGLSSQTKGSMTLVGGELSTPSAGDSVEVALGQEMGANFPPLTFNLQVGGYSLKSSAAGASTLSLDLYDTSNDVLDNNHIVLKEEIPEDIATPSNVYELGRKVSPIPSSSLVSNGLMGANKDTQWGDTRDFYKQTIKPCEEADGDGTARVDQQVKSAPGKTLWGAVSYWGEFGNDDITLQTALGDVLAEGSEMVGGMFDFKGTFREVIVAYCSALGLQAWWDCDTEEVVIKLAVDAEDGFSKLAAIAEACEVTSAGSTVDFTTTFTKGAVGSITSSYQAENQNSGGMEMSRFLRASPLRPTFHYRACRHRDGDEMTELDFSDTDTLKAVRASANEKVWAAYALQAVLADADVQAKGKTEIYRVLKQHVPIVFNQGKGLVADAEGWGEIAITWPNVLPHHGTIPNLTANTLLQNYYKPIEQGAIRPCSALLASFRFADDGPAKVATSVNNVAAGIKTQVARVGEGNAKNTQIKGWNNNTNKCPADPLGEWSLADGSWANGRLVISANSNFDSILSESKLQGKDDLLRQYLAAIYKFQNRFWVIKEDRSTCAGQSVDVAGQSYGYYITSSTQKSTMSLSAPEGYRVINLNPFKPLGECGCAELKALAEVAALMYLPRGVSLAEVMGRSPDPDNPIPSLREGYDGVAVIDFVRALDTGSLQGLFKSDAEVVAAPVQRAQAEEDDDEPTLTMYLLTVEEAIDELSDVPQISYRSQERGLENVGGNNQGETQDDEDAEGPAMKYAEKMICPLDDLDEIGFWDSAMGNIEDGAPLDAMGVWTNTPGGTVLDLNGTIPATIFRLADLTDPFAGLPFIPAAVIAPRAGSQKITYKVSGASNNVSDTPSEFTLTGMVPPGTNCWKGKIDFGLSLNAADIGRDNSMGQSWEANSSNQGNGYSVANRSDMLSELYMRLGQAAVTDSENANSRTISFVLTQELLDSRDEETNEPTIQWPTPAEGLEAFQITLNGTKTEISLSVGNNLQREAAKAMYERVVQFPSTQYKPSSLMPNSLKDGTSSKFQLLMKGM